MLSHGMQGYRGLSFFSSRSSGLLACIRMHRNCLRILSECDLCHRSMLAMVAAILLAISFPVRAQTRLSFVPIQAHVFGDPPFPISATSPSSAPVSYEVESGPAVLSGNMLTLTSGGTVRLAARQAAAGRYGASTAKTSFLVSTKASQTMIFAQAAAVVKSTIASDTPNFLFIDSDGRFFLQNADSEYDTVPANHVWDFYTGKNAQDPKITLSRDNSQFDTQTICEAGNPVYKEFYKTPGVKPGSGRFVDGNFCDAIGVWIDPDTGNWYAIVHNELYPNIPRIDAISYAISTDHGKHWMLQAPIATSPYGVGNKQDDYYDYGEGDPRLVVDTSVGYFYLFYNSRIMTPSGKGFSDHEWEHVSRAPIRDKMRPDSWEKYENGVWSRHVGIDWTCDAAGSSPCAPGQIASSLSSSIGADGDPTIHQTFVQPISKQQPGDLAGYTNSLLHTASVSWSVYLGKYIAFAEERDLGNTDEHKGAADNMTFYVSDDLSKQKWTYAGSVPYRNSSWYRWMVDPGNLSSTKTIGRSFLAYCAVDCSNPDNESEYLPISVSLAGKALPRYYSGAHELGSVTDTYLIGHKDGNGSAASESEAWKFVPVADDEGFFYVEKGKMELGVADGDAGRAWGAAVSLHARIPATSSAPERSRQQWYFEAIKTDGAEGGAPTSEHRYRLINRYSGLALSVSGSALTAATLQDALTAPIRDWDAQGAAGIFKVWKAADQELLFTAVHRASK